MNDFFKKILSVRITDTVFKGIFLGATTLVALSVFFLLSRASTLENSIKTASAQKSVTVIDESGNSFKKKLYENNMDIATVFGITYAKKYLSYGYLNYNRVINYIKTFSSKEVTEHFLSTLRKNKILIQLKILNGSNIATIKNYRIVNEKDSNNKFIMYFIIKQELVSESKNTSKELFMKINILLGEPTAINSSGIFVINTELEEFNLDKHGQIFGLNK